MLSGWDGNGFDNGISEEELKKVGYETCSKYCFEYCWDYGRGWCPYCAYDKEREKRRMAESERVNE